MEWKSMMTDKPEIGKTYLVISGNGECAVRRYVRGYRYEGNQITQDTRVGLCGCEYGYCKPLEIIEGFITTGGWRGRRVKDPRYFMELPPMPELTQEEKIAWQIRDLEKRLEMLERKKEC